MRVGGLPRGLPLGNLDARGEAALRTVVLKPLLFVRHLQLTDVFLKQVQVGHVATGLATVLGDVIAYRQVARHILATAVVEGLVEDHGLGTSLAIAVARRVPLPLVLVFDGACGADHAGRHLDVGGHALTIGELTGGDHVPRFDEFVAIDAPTHGAHGAVELGETLLHHKGSAAGVRRR